MKRADGEKRYVPNESQGGRSLGLGLGLGLGYRMSRRGVEHWTDLVEDRRLLRRTLRDSEDADSEDGDIADG